MNTAIAIIIQYGAQFLFACSLYFRFTVSCSFFPFWQIAVILNVCMCGDVMMTKITGGGTKNKEEKDEVQAKHV